MTPADFLADVAAIDGIARDGTASGGSGRLIAPGLVLTAAHVVDAEVAAWRVVLLRDRLSDGTWTRAYAADVVFSGAGTPDLALLRLRAERPPEPRLRHLHVVYEDLDQLAEVQTAGFPDARRAPGGSLRDYRVFGQLRIATASAPYTYTVEQADKPDIPGDWRGFSGSAVVWIGPDQRLHLFGAAQRVPDNFTLGGQLDVARLADAHAHAPFRDALRQCLGAVPSWVRWRRPDTSPRPPPVRSTVPTTSRRFIGRAASFDAIEAALGDTQRAGIVVLRGPPGVGKSGLAEEYVRLHQPSYPGGTFLLDAAAGALAINLANLGRSVLRPTIDPTLSPVDQAVATLLHLSAEPTMLIYDNVQSENAARPFLPRAGAPCHVIITTLLDSWGEDYVLPVRPLTDDEAYALVEDRAGEALAASHGRDILANAGGLPVELNPAARALSRAAKRGLLDITTATLTAKETEGSFQAAYNLLALEPRLLLHAAAHLNPLQIGRDLLRDHMREGLGWSDAHFVEHLSACFDLHLVEGNKVLRMHQLFAAFLNGREDQSGLTEPLAAIVRAQASRLLAVARDVAAKPNRLDLASLLTMYLLKPERWLVRQAALSSADGTIIGQALIETGRFAAAQPWFERAVAVAEQGDAHGRVDHASLGTSLHQVGSCLSSRGEFAAAQPWFERAVPEAEKGDVHGRVDHDSIGRSLHMVGYCLASRGEFSAAQPWFEHAVAEAERGDLHGRIDHDSLGRSLHQVGSCLLSRGEFAAAQPWFERAVAEQEQGDVHGRVDHESLGRSLDHVGDFLSSRGEFAAAQPWFERAVAEKEQGDVHGRIDHDSLGRSLNRVGYCLASRGEFAAAQPWFERAVAEQEQGDMYGRVDHDSLGHSVHQVGSCLFGRGEFAAAQSWFESAVAEMEQGDVHGRVDHEGLGRSLHQVGSCLSSRGESAAAQPWFERAVAEQEQGDVHGRVDHASLGGSLNAVGSCLLGRGEFAVAQPWFERAVAEVEQGDVHGRVDHANLGRGLHGVGYCMASRGEFAVAQPWLERAVAEKEQGDVHGRVNHASLGGSLHDVGYCLVSRGEFAVAQPWFERAVAEAKQGDVHGRVEHALVSLFQEHAEINRRKL